MAQSKIYAVCGMTGSGKTEVIKILEEFGYNRVHFGGLVTSETLNRGLELNEDNERGVRNELREKHGMAAIAILSLPVIEELIKDGKNVVIDGLYSWEEYKVLKEKFADNLVMIAVHSSPATRYARLVNRDYRPYTPEKAKSRDYSETEELNKGGPIAMSDFHFVNEDNLDSLRDEVIKSLKLGDIKN